MYKAALSLMVILMAVSNNQAASATARIYKAPPPAPTVRVSGGRLRRGLPPTNLDSFVTEAGSKAELIYGDEGVGMIAEKSGEASYPISPYMGFTPEHRIATGFTGTTYQGLTTGHGAVMPSAWGRDEFLGAEYNLSAPVNSAPQTGSAANAISSQNNAVQRGAQNMMTNASRRAFQTVSQVAQQNLGNQYSMVENYAQTAIQSGFAAVQSNTNYSVNSANNAPETAYLTNDSGF